MKRLVKTLILMPIAALWLWAFVVEPHLMLDSEHVEISLKGWNKNLDGLKIAVVGDIHAGWGPHENRRVQAVVDEINSQKPDIILLVGDYVNGAIFQSKMDPKRLSDYLSQLKAPLGVYAILGNHDTYYGVKKVRKIIQDAGITLLEDSNVKIATPKGNFYVAGISDPVTREYYYAKALEGVEKGAPVILLAHSPQIFNEIPVEVGVTFSGHTHGGQIVLPYVGALFSNTSNGLVEGLLKEDGKTIYTTRGVGTSRAPVRFNCPPLVTIVTLKKADEI